MLCAFTPHTHCKIDSQKEGKKKQAPLGVWKRLQWLEGSLEVKRLQHLANMFYTSVLDHIKLCLQLFDGWILQHLECLTATACILARVGPQELRNCCPFGHGITNGKDILPRIFAIELLQHFLHGLFFCHCQWANSFLEVTIRTSHHVWLDALTGIDHRNAQLLKKGFYSELGHKLIGRIGYPRSSGQRYNCNLSTWLCQRQQLPHSVTDFAQCSMEGSVCWQSVLHCLHNMPSWKKSIVPIKNDGGFIWRKWLWCHLHLTFFAFWLGFCFWETQEVKELVGKREKSRTFTFGLFRILMCPRVCCWIPVWASKVWIKWKRLFPRKWERNLIFFIWAFIKNTTSSTTRWATWGWISSPRFNWWSQMWQLGRWRSHHVLQATLKCHERQCITFSKLGPRAVSRIRYMLRDAM